MAMFDENVQNHMGTIAVQYMSYEHYPKTSHQGVFGSSFITAGFALKTTDLAISRAESFGVELADYIEAGGARSRRNKTSRRQPEYENRVELASAKDEVRHRSENWFTVLMRTRWRSGTPTSKWD